MQIQPYAERYSREIADLFHCAVHQIDESLYCAAQKEAWAPTPPDYAFWQQRLSHKKPWLALIDNRVAGFMELDPDGHIDCAYVHPDFQRRGVATALLNYVMEHVIEHVTAHAADPGTSISQLYVEASAAALPFFTRHGFKQYGTHEVRRHGVSLLQHLLRRHLN